MRQHTAALAILGIFLLLAGAFACKTPKEHAFTLSDVKILDVSTDNFPDLELHLRALLDGRPLGESAPGVQAVYAQVNGRPVSATPKVVPVEQPTSLVILLSPVDAADAAALYQGILASLPGEIRGRATTYVNTHHGFVPYTGPGDLALPSGAKRTALDESVQALMQNLAKGSQPRYSRLWFFLGDFGDISSRKADGLRTQFDRAASRGDWFAVQSNNFSGLLNIFGNGDKAKVENIRRRLVFATPLAKEHISWDALKSALGTLDSSAYTLRVGLGQQDLDGREITLEIGFKRGMDEYQNKKRVEVSDAMRKDYDILALMAKAVRQFEDGARDQALETLEQGKASFGDPRLDGKRRELIGRWVPEAVQQAEAQFAKGRREQAVAELRILHGKLGDERLDEARKRLVSQWAAASPGDIVALRGFLTACDFSAASPLGQDDAALAEAVLRGWAAAMDDPARDGMSLFEDLEFQAGKWELEGSAWLLAEKKDVLTRRYEYLRGQDPKSSELELIASTLMSLGAMDTVSAMRMDEARALTAKGQYAQALELLRATHRQTGNAELLADATGIKNSWAKLAGKSVGYKEMLQKFLRNMALLDYKAKGYAAGLAEAMLQSWAGTIEPKTTAEIVEWADMAGAWKMDQKPWYAPTKTRLYAGLLQYREQSGGGDVELAGLTKTLLKLDSTDKAVLYKDYLFRSRIKEAEGDKASALDIAHAGSKDKRLGDGAKDLAVRASSLLGALMLDRNVPGDKRQALGSKYYEVLAPRFDLRLEYAVLSRQQGKVDAAIDEYRWLLANWDKEQQSITWVDALSSLQSLYMSAMHFIDAYDLLMRNASISQDPTERFKLVSQAVLCQRGDSIAPFLLGVHKLAQKHSAAGKSLEDLKATLFDSFRPLFDFRLCKSLCAVAADGHIVQSFPENAGLAGFKAAEMTPRKGFLYTTRKAESGINSVFVGCALGNEYLMVEFTDEFDPVSRELAKAVAQTPENDVLWRDLVRYYRKLAARPLSQLLGSVIGTHYLRFGGDGLQDYAEETAKVPSLKYYSVYSKNMELVFTSAENFPGAIQADEAQWNRSLETAALFVQQVDFDGAKVQDITNPIYLGTWQGVVKIGFDE